MVQRRFFVLTASGELGPHDPQELRDLLRAGTIVPGDRLRTALGASAGTVAQALALPGGGDATRPSSGGVASPRPRPPSRADLAPRQTRTLQRRTGTRPLPPVEEPAEEADEEDGGQDSVDERASAPRRPPVLAIAIGAVLVAAGVGWYLLQDRPQPLVAAPQPPAVVAPPAAAGPVIELEPRETAWYPGIEGAVILRLSAPSSTPLTVPLLVGGTAVPGVDVVAPPAQVTVPAGTTSLAVPVMALPKSVKRGKATELTVALDTAVGGTSRGWTAGKRASTVIPVQKSDRGMTWLSALPLAGSWCAYRPPGIDISFAGSRLTLQGFAYDRGISLHPGEQMGDDAWVAYRLDGKYDEFLCDVGIDDEAGEAGSCVFRVEVDGRVRFDSGEITRRDPPRQVRVAVGGAKELRLITTWGERDPNNASDHGDWAGARLVKR